MFQKVGYIVVLFQHLVPPKYNALFTLENGFPWTS
jgi:hypothetical protein